MSTEHTADTPDTPTWAAPRLLVHPATQAALEIGTGSDLLDTEVPS